ncbi:MAG: trypsin-like peptidase domain-containing protein [Actinomycetota bacterium]|nr:trypsin-like peptidase domain-containing protein [Actinomycetota bacterium]
MRAGSVALVALVAAVLGGVSVAVVGKAAGWFGNTKRTVIVQTPPAAEPASQATPDTSKPLTGNGFDSRAIYRKRARGVVTIFSVYGSSSSAQEAQGSGFVVSPKGYILTNSHVITTAGGSGSSTKAASEVYVEFQDHDRVSAKVVGWDIFDDVGLIKVKPDEHLLTPVPLGNSSGVLVGDPVAAIGSPFGNENSLTVGVVSAIERSIPALTSDYNLVDAIQTDAPINHGNSGGPLFDARGRVVGINAQIRSNSGVAEGVGFAVPIDSARRSMTQLIAAGRVSYAFVGIETQDLTPTLAKRFHYPVEHGAVITAVHSHTPGAAAGLRGGTSNEEVLGMRFTRGGDVIVAIDGRPVRSAEDVVRIVSGRVSPGETVGFTIYRGNARKTVMVKLAERPASPKRG